MPLNWFDPSNTSFNALLLLERVQIGWFRTWNFPEPDLCLALAGNPSVAWFLCHKCPEMADWVEHELRLAEALAQPPAPEELRRCEVSVLNHLQDLLVYALDPAIYDAQPFLQWDSRELVDIVNFEDKVVIDVGAGTGRLAFVAAPWARVATPHSTPHWAPSNRTSRWAPWVSAPPAHCCSSSAPRPPAA